MRNQANNLKATYDIIADDWFRDHNEDSWWKPGVDAFASLLKPGNLVVDVGCGAGQKTKYLLNKGLKVIGTDISEKMIEIANRQVPGAEFQTLDMYHQTELGIKAEGLFLQAVLLHVPKHEVVVTVQSMLPILRPDGFVYIAVKEQSLGGVSEEVKTEKDYGYTYQRFFSYYTVEEMRQLMRSLSLIIRYEHIVTTPDTNWIQMIGQSPVSI